VFCLRHGGGALGGPTSLGSATPPPPKAEDRPLPPGWSRGFFGGAPTLTALPRGPALLPTKCRVHYQGLEGKVSKLKDGGRWRVHSPPPSNFLICLGLRIVRQRRVWDSPLRREDPGPLSHPSLFTSRRSLHGFRLIALDSFHCWAGLSPRASVMGSGQLFQHLRHESLTSCICFLVSKSANLCRETVAPGRVGEGVVNFCEFRISKSRLFYDFLRTVKWMMSFLAPL